MGRASPRAGLMGGLIVDLNEFRQENVDFGRTCRLWHPHCILTHHIAGVEFSKKGTTVQRYKGLGEMNPDQLWDTTLDPEYRSILKVRVEDAQRADEIFEELMGEDVEKRKFFIQSNAKKVSNLDV